MSDSNVPVSKQTRGFPLPYLRAWRIAKALDQTLLAERSGVTRAQINRLEAGLYTAQARTVAKLANALGITSEQLIHQAPPAMM